MDRLQLTLSQAEQLLTRARPGEAGLADREQWLNEAVCPLVEDLVCRQRFRELARWPLQHLAAGQASAAYRDLSAEVGRRPWRELVEVEEYLRPCPGLRTDSEERFRPGEHELFSEVCEVMDVPGDNLSRLLLLRLDYWRESVLRLWRWCLALVNRLPPPLQEEADRLAIDAVNLRESCRSLRQLCLGGPPARLRGSCIALVQALAAYGSCPQLGWLGLWQGQGEDSRGLLRLRWRQALCPEGEPNRLLRAVVGALLDVQGLCGPPTPEDVLAEALGSSLLVLVEQPRSAYWRGRLVEAHWDGRPLLWELLWELARRARQGRALDRLDLSNSDSSRALVNRRSRLGGLLPGELDRRICAAGRGSYRLELAAGEITLLARDQQEQLCVEGAVAGPLSGRS